MGNVHSCRSNNNNNNNNQNENQNNNNVFQFNLNYYQYWQCYCWGEGAYGELRVCPVLWFTPQQCLPPNCPPLVPIMTQFTHVCSQRHAYSVHAITHMVIYTAAAATVHIQPQKQDGCVDFVALFALFWLYVKFFFTLLYYFITDFLFWEEQRALRAKG